MSKEDPTFTETIINRNIVPFIPEETLASFIKACQEPDDYITWEAVERVFTEVPVPELMKFCRRNVISLDELRAYYERFIKGRGTRVYEVEALFRVW